MRYIRIESSAPPLLLDAYGSSSFAIALRLLRTAYAGDCIKVRRSSDNTTSDIGFVSGVLDTASLLSFVGANDGFVHTIYDQSGAGNDATQTTNGNQPQIVSSGTLNLINSKPAMLFDGVNDGFNLSAPISFGTTHSLFFTHQTTQNVSVILGNSSPVANINNDATRLTYNASGVFTQSAAGAWNLSTQYIHSIIRGGTAAVDAWSNGSTVALADLSSNASLTISTIGGRAVGSIPFGGSVQEIVTYTSDQTANQTGIETNTNDFYSAF